MILSIADDFDLDRIAGSGQCFRWERITDGSWRILHGSECLYALDRGDGHFSFSCEEEKFDNLWREYFDLSEDYTAIRRRIDPEADPFLWTAAERERGIRILRQDPWETLITFILSQNKNIPGIRRCVEALCAACGEKKTDVRGREFYAFPSPAALAALGEESLRSCRLGYRCRYVHAAAEAVRDGKLDLNALRRAEEDAALLALQQLPGVGIKVASCVALFGLHRLDAFPRDVWVKRILASEYPGGYPMERYSPYNGVYQQYMFAWYRTKEAKPRTAGAVSRKK